ncbi:MAG: phosphoribosylamine--glycine ligase [Candidatus Omnitrophica bacterium]|nr:phosphoribosylamine--glycine ligase [Candidatus Omnitrophota bacterium]
MNVLVIGSGGREHCLVWKLRQSPHVARIFCAPGNGGTAKDAENTEIAATDGEALLRFAEERDIGLTVVGPEVPLVDGIVDRFESRGLRIFGPRRACARLEGSKIYAKEVMDRFDIPTASWRAFDNPGDARNYIRGRSGPLVVKADGLAAGKGVVVCKTREEALTAADRMLVHKEFGAAGEKILVEDFLAGEEASILLVTDGETVIPLISSQDHKRIGEGDRGPNTGGMGAYAPAPLVSGPLMENIHGTICEPLIKGLGKQGMKYRGVLYIGLMISGGNPYVLEFNVRFGDPETQVVVPKLQSDLYELMDRTVQGQLAGTVLSWDPRFCVGVVLASGGYPGPYQKGKKIEGLDCLPSDVTVFHAGTRAEPARSGEGYEYFTQGGRVLTVTGLDPLFPQAQRKVYEAAEKIRFEGRSYRKDIGNKALKFLSEGVK